MKITDSLKPHENQRVMDLVAAGGVNDPLECIEQR